MLSAVNNQDNKFDATKFFQKYNVLPTERPCTKCNTGTLTWMAVTSEMDGRMNCNTCDNRQVL